MNKQYFFIVLYDEEADHFYADYGVAENEAGPDGAWLYIPSRKQWKTPDQIDEHTRRMYKLLYKRLHDLLMDEDM